MESRPRHTLCGQVFKIAAAPTVSAVVVLGVLGCSEGPRASPPNAAPAAKAAAQAAPSVDVAKELMITDLSVVNDPARTGPGGAWSFGELFTRLHPGKDARAEMRKWLLNWRDKQTINEDAIAARDTICTRVIEKWMRADGIIPTDPCTDEWLPNFANAPFRLLAIVNRIDLALTPTGPVDPQLQAGEGRFVYCLTDGPAANPRSAPKEFTVIFEFRLPANSEGDRMAWAKAWHALGTVPFGGEYNAALNVITDRFATANNLKQVRTNEIELSTSWQLREFRLDPVTGSLAGVTAKVTPRDDMDGKRLLGDFVRENREAILQFRHDIPERFKDQPFLAGASVARFNGRWTVPGFANTEERFNLAFGTCNGCHTGETNTVFTHVKTRAADRASELSAFLTGKGNSRDFKGQPFEDLDRRAKFLNDVLSGTGPEREPSDRERRMRIRVH